MARINCQLAHLKRGCLVAPPYKKNLLSDPKGNPRKQASKAFRKNPFEPECTQESISWNHQEDGLR